MEGQIKLILGRGCRGQQKLGNNGTWQGPPVSLSDMDTWLHSASSDLFKVYFVTCSGNCQIYVCGITDEVHSASSYFTTNLPNGMAGQKQTFSDINSYTCPKFFWYTKCQRICPPKLLGRSNKKVEEVTVNVAFIVVASLTSLFCKRNKKGGKQYRNNCYAPKLQNRKSQQAAKPPLLVSQARTKF